MSYTRVNWQDAPSVSTPLSASNLNKMDAGIKQNADDIEELQQHTYDAELNNTSTNAPQTKAVYEALQELDIETDTTLSVSGKAADAAATGEAVTQLKNAIDALKIVNTASGAIASFPDGAAMPMEALSVEMSPIQDLHGQDAPYPAGGGKNKFDKTATNTDNGYAENSSLNTNGVVGGSSNFNVSEYIPVKASTAYTLHPCSGIAAGYGLYDANKVWLSGGKYDEVSTVTFTTTAETAYIRVTIPKVNIDTFQLEEGSTATDYAPYSNICPISGRSAVTVWRYGTNFFDGQMENGDISETTGQNSGASSSRRRCVNYIPLPPGTTSLYFYNSGRSTVRLFYYRADKSYMYLNTIDTNKVYTLPASAQAEARYIRFRYASAAVDSDATASVNIPSTDHDYHAYDGQSATIQLGSTIYGGTVDVTTGVMTVTHAIVDLGDTNWVVPSLATMPFRTQAVSTLPMFDGKIPKYNENFICTMYPSAGIKAYDTVPDGTIAFTNGTVDNPGGNMIRIHDSGKVGMTAAEFKAYISGTMLCYELLEPFTVQLTPAQLSTLKGQNNVWSDADSVTVEYVADPKLYIARLTEPDADMVADANITAGHYFMVGNTLYLATSNIASGANIVPGVNCTRTNLAAALNAINA